MRIPSDLQIWRIVSTLLCIVIVFNLFYIGGKSIAVGLFHPPLDKIAHFFTFSLISFLLWVGLLRGRPWLVGGITGAVAVADEVHQMYLPGRAAGLDDFVVDMLAIVFTVLILMRVSRFLEIRKNKL